MYKEIANNSEISNDSNDSYLHFRNIGYTATTGNLLEDLQFQCAMAEAQFNEVLERESQATSDDAGLENK